MSGGWGGKKSSRNTSHRDGGITGRRDADDLIRYACTKGKPAEEAGLADGCGTNSSRKSYQGGRFQNNRRMRGGSGGIFHPASTTRCGTRGWLWRIRIGSNGEECNPTIKTIHRLGPPDNQSYASRLGACVTREKTHLNAEHLTLRRVMVYLKRG